VTARLPDTATTAPFVAGRSCPLSYRYTAQSLAALPTLDTEVLYCVGGLYGNSQALDALEILLARETRELRVVFNGDFHWFDATADAFSEIEARTSSDPRYVRTRGNVETELASDDDTGCGCGYPDSVDDSVVAHSNDILRALRSASRGTPAVRACLAALPMQSAFQVGSQRVVAVHGDLESLAGWQLDPLSLDDPALSQRVSGQMAAANADIVASSHTCLPALRLLGAPGRGVRTVANNGAAGMPCFSNSQFGIVTRIAASPAARSGIEALYGVEQSGVFVEAIALQFNFVAWRDAFLAIWPAASAAHRSYFSRIERGTNFSVRQALGEH
jgi:hypothetical protein